MKPELPPSMELLGSSPSQSATDAAEVKSLPPRAIITNGCRSNNIAEVSRGIQAASLNEHHKDSELLSWSLSRAVYHGQPDVVQYLLEQEGASLDSLSPIIVAASPSIPLFQILVDHGWDINQSQPDRGAGPGKCLLQLVCDDESLVRWCLDHGALVQDRHTDPYRCPPLLEIVAGVGTVSTFSLLHSRAAQLGPRTLHRAVGSAAASSDDSERLIIRMAMVKYLVDDLGLDVNALDTESQVPNHWGTPLCYAARVYRGGEEVVRFLLDRGADPSIKDCWGIHDAFGVAEFTKNSQISELLQVNEEDDLQFWKNSRDIDGLKRFVGSSFPPTTKGMEGGRNGVIEGLWGKLTEGMGAMGAMREFTWPVVLILATRAGS